MHVEGVSHIGSTSRIPGKTAVTILYLALTLLLAYPISLNPAGRVLSDDPDAHLFMWTLAWDTHAFVHQPFSIFDANIYHPQRRTLAYSENLIGSAFFAAPVLWITGNPVLAMNLISLLSCVLCGLGAYVLARRVGIGPAGATLCGLIFAFTPPRFFRLPQLHLTAVQWVPFGLASLHAYLVGGRKIDLRLAAAFFTLQALTSGHGVVFLALAGLCRVGYHLLAGNPLAFAKRVRDLGLPGALLLAPGLLIFLPYRAVQVEVGLRRTLAGWAPYLTDFLASPTHVHTFLLSLVPGARILQRANAFLFPGFLTLLLAAAAFRWRAAASAVRRRIADRTAWAHVAVLLEVAIVACLAIAVAVTVAGPIRIRRGSTLLFSSRDPLRPWILCAVGVALRIALGRRVPLDFATRARHTVDAVRRWFTPRREDMTTFFGLLTFLSVWLAAGPPISIWPLVYWLPGLNFIRAPSRFMVLAVLGLAVLAGIGFERLSARFGPRRRVLLATLAGALLVAEFAAIPVATVPYQVRIPSADRWLAFQPQPFVVAELPVMKSERYHTVYMLHSMAHWQKTIHGYSGVRPPLHEELYAQLMQFPDEAGLNSLAELGVNYVVVHEDMYLPGQWPDVEERLERYHAWLTLEYAGGGGRVYSLRRPPARGLR